MERNPFPEFKLVDPVGRLKKIGAAVLDYLSFPLLGEEYNRLPGVKPPEVEVQPQLFDYPTIPDIQGRDL